MNQLAIDFSRAERNEAMKRAVDAADGRVPKWSDVALEYVRLYAIQHRGERFIGRDVTQAAKGYAQDPNRHLSPVPQWEAA